MINKGVAVSAFTCALALFAAGGPVAPSRPADLRDAPADNSWAGGSISAMEVPVAAPASESVPETGPAEALELSRAIRARWTVQQAERMLRLANEAELRYLGRALGPGEEDYARQKLAAVGALLRHAKAHTVTAADISAAEYYMAPGFAATLVPEQETSRVEAASGFGGRGSAKGLSLEGYGGDSRFAARGFPAGDMARIRALVEAARQRRDSAGHVHGWQGNARQAFNPFLKRIGADREIPDSGCSSWAFASIEAMRSDRDLAAKYDTAAIYGWKLLPHFVALVWPKGADPLSTGLYVDAWASKTEIGTLGEWRRFYSFINVVQPDGMRECDLDDWHGDFSSGKCW